MSTAGTSSDPVFLSFQQTLAGRYSIDRELGRGGMGIVYLAREVHLDRFVAIKLLPPDKATEPALRERFLREVRLAAKLSHPNIIPIHAVEDTGGFVFYVMAFIDGETLAHRVRTRGPLPGSEGARMLREVAWALAHAHGKGFVHRDVKPDNILIEAATGRVLVADFGIAAAIGDMSADGVSGTPEFMSPEQVLGKQIDARSDVYGLGATGFYVFSGRFPFEGRSATEVLAKQATEPAPQLGSLGLAVPRRLASLIDRCLAKDPNNRPASAEALAEQLGVAIEQRKELPAALRAFVKRSARLNGGATLISGLLLLPVSIATSAYYGTAAGYSVFLLGAIAAPFAYLVGAARRLLVLGFTHQDLGPAFAAEMEQAREELNVARNPGSSRVAKWLRVVAKVSAATSALFGLFLANFRAEMRWELAIFIFSGVTAVLSAAGALVAAQQYEDTDTAFWSKVWMGRIGRSVFAVARKLLGKRTRQSAMTHRATELSLGLAAEHLYESLPKESQQALGGLPALLVRLQRDAQSLRKRYDALQDALGDAPDSTSVEYTDIREIRDSVHVKLGDAVGALETIRLNLLRLHAGSTSVESLTTQLEIAGEVSEEVERLIEAHADVERTIRFPRLAASTPV
jgi:serine/threonine-protein kinase